MHKTLHRVHINTIYKSILSLEKQTNKLSNITTPEDKVKVTRVLKIPLAGVCAALKTT